MEASTGVIHVDPGTPDAVMWEPGNCSYDPDFCGPSTAIGLLLLSSSVEPRPSGPAEGGHGETELQSSEAALSLASAVPGQYRAQEVQTSRDWKAIMGEG